jgi:hypothetical protein
MDSLKKSSAVLLILVLAGAVTLSFSPRLSAAYSSDYNPGQLSYGLYWFGAAQTAKKFVSGEVNPYFDSTKPTLIFAHGWQPNLSYSCPPDFQYDVTCDQRDAGSDDTIQAWISAGWNVGIFYWNQFSDEPSVPDAEAKIWTNNGPQQMRWRKWTSQWVSTYQAAPTGTKSAGELFFEAYVAALTAQDYTGGNIRIAGHSLGNQMVVRLAKLVSDAVDAGTVPQKLLPNRVVLLDPYWSTGAKDYLGGKGTGQVVREYVHALIPKGVLFEWYWASNLGGDGNDELKRMMLYAEMNPGFVSDQMSKHQAAVNIYFWSYAFAGPDPCTGDDCHNMTKVLAKMSDAQLAAAMQSNYTWTQDAGIGTASPQDDTFQNGLRANAPYLVTQITASPSTQAVGQPVLLTATVVDKNNASAGDGILVALHASAGIIPPRTTTSGGTVQLSFTSLVSGTVTIAASTRGTGGPTQATVNVIFSDTVTTTPTVSLVVHDATHSVVSSAPIGSAVHARATVSGSGLTPTGTVNFTVFANMTCAGSGTAAGTLALDASGVAHPSNSAAVASSGLSFKAHYNGDAHYTAADSACQSLAACEWRAFLPMVLNALR